MITEEALREMERRARWLRPYSGIVSDDYTSLIAEVRRLRLLGKRATGCVSCGEKTSQDECPKSKRDCGHHCNCSWVHDKCCWCGEDFGDE